jgi:hypothetical protein
MQTLGFTAISFMVPSSAWVLRRLKISGAVVAAAEARSVGHRAALEQQRPQPIDLCIRFGRNGSARYARRSAQRGEPVVNPVLVTRRKFHSFLHQA